jgi:MFS family permease
MSAPPDVENEERLLRGHTGRVLLTVSLGWALIQTGRLALPPLLPRIIEDLSITSFWAGFGLSVMWGVYALLQFPGGQLSDKLSRKSILIPGVGILIMGFILLVFAPLYSIFLFSLSIIGLGAGLYQTPSRALVSDLFVEHRGQAFGVISSAGNVGGAVAAGLAILIAGSWRPVFIPIILGLILVLLGIHLFSRDGYCYRRANIEITATARRIFRSRRMLLMITGYSLFMFAWQGTISFFPTFLQIEKSLSIGISSSGFAMLFIVGIFIKPAAGTIGDRIGHGLVSGGLLFMGAIGLGIMVFVTSPLVLAGSILCFAIGLMGYPVPMQSYLMDTFPDQSIGGDFGIVRTIYLLIGSLGPTYVGYLSGTRGFSVAFSGLVLCLCVGSAAVFGAKYLQT